MTKARVGNELPRPVTALAVVFWGKPVPEKVDAVFDIIWLALQRCPKSGRIKLFNRKMGQLKRRNPDIFDALHDWLVADKTREMLSKVGHAYLQQCWLDAIGRIRKGTKASVAFNRRGRPHAWQFSEHDHKVFKTERLLRSGMRLDAAIEHVFGLSLCDDREVRRKRHHLRVRSIPSEFLEVA